MIAFAGSCAAVKSLLRVCDGKLVFAGVGIHLAEDGVGHGEIGVSLDGVLEVRNRLRLVAAVSFGLAEAERF